MTSEFAVRGDGLVLALRVERYEFPEITTGSDANWLVAAAELEIGSTGAFTARHKLSLFTTDLAGFRDQLRSLDRALSGEAILEHIEDQTALHSPSPTGVASSPASSASTWEPPSASIASQPTRVICARLSGTSMRS